jgi:uncharacterized protein DUF6714
MDTHSLLAEIDQVLPPVSKPKPNAVPIHATGCGQCDDLRADLAEYNDPVLPPEAIRYIHNDLSCLSAHGLRWVLPSYLKVCLTRDKYDPLETEFPIYSLAPSPEDEPDTRQRLSALNLRQLMCLLHFLEWCRDHAHWSAYCPEEIADAILFLQSVANAYEEAQPCVYGLPPKIKTNPKVMANRSACSRISGIMSELCKLWLVPTWNLPTRCQSLQLTVRR